MRPYPPLALAMYSTAAALMPPTCRVENDHPEHFDPRHRLPDRIRHAGRGFVMILENEAAHAAVLGELREVNHVNGARPFADVVGIGVGVDVDHPRQRLRTQRQRKHQQKH